MKILLSAYSCQPNIGSEGGIGWNWALEIARRGHDVWVITRENNRKNIEKFRNENSCADAIRFVYYDLPDRWLKNKHLIGIYVYYQLWQKGILQVAQQLDNSIGFDLVHHITFGVFRQNTYLYKLNKPLYLGPLGGGERMPGFLLKSLPLGAIAFEYLRLLSNKISWFNPALIKSFEQAERIYFKTRESLESIPRKYWVKSQITNDIGSFNHVNTTNAKTHSRQDFTVLYVGRLVHWKGPHLAVSAFAELHRRHPTAKMVLIGSGPFKKDLQKIITQHQLDSAVEILEEVPQQVVFDHFQKAKVFLFPTLHDSSGTVIYEALSFGLPVVTVNLNGPGFIMGKDYEPMVKIVKGDTEQTVIAKLGEKLLRLYSDPHYYNEQSHSSLYKAEHL